MWMEVHSRVRAYMQKQACMQLAAPSIELVLLVVLVLDPKLLNLETPKPECLIVLFVLVALTGQQVHSS